MAITNSTVSLPSTHNECLDSNVPGSDIIIVSDYFYLYCKRQLLQ